MKSPRLDSSSSPTGESSDSGSSEMRSSSRTRSGSSCTRAASSSIVGSRSSSWCSWRLARMHPVHVLDHVHRDADRAGLVGDRAGDRLADPPRGVRRELEALGVVELVDRPHQAEVALLDQVEQLHAAARVALGDAHDEAQVGLGQLALGPLARAGRRASGGASRRRVEAAARRCARRRRWPSSISWARRRSSSPVSRSTWPISRRYMRTPSDVAAVAPRRRLAAPRRRRRRLSSVSSASSASRSARPAERRASACRRRRRLVDRRRPSRRARCRLVGERRLDASSSTSPVSSTSRSTVRDLARRATLPRSRPRSMRPVPLGVDVDARHGTGDASTVDGASSDCRQGPPLERSSISSMEPT